MNWAELNCTIRQCTSAVTACTPLGSLPSRLQHSLSKLPGFSIPPQCQWPRRRAAMPIRGVVCRLFVQICSLLVSAFRGKKSMSVKDPCLRREQLFQCYVSIVKTYSCPKSSFSKQTLNLWLMPPFVAPFLHNFPSIFGIVFLIRFHMFFFSAFWSKVSKK